MHSIRSQRPADATKSLTLPWAYTQPVGSQRLYKNSLPSGICAKA